MNWTHTFRIETDRHECGARVYMAKSHHKQVLELRRIFEEAKADAHLIIWNENYPEYPDSLANCMQFLSESNLCATGNYIAGAQRALQDIKSASVEDISCLFTMYLRSERWCTGAWKALVEGDDFEMLLSRAEHIYAKDK